MNFIEAVKAMKEGKKVKRKDYTWCCRRVKNYRMVLEYIDENKGTPRQNLDIDDFEATDWEIVEEKKTLSDKIVPREHDTNNYVTPEHLKPEDAKESIKEFIDSKWIKDFIGDGNKYFILRQKVKEIFGERLIE